MSITRVAHQHIPRVVVIGSLTEDHVICDGTHVRQIGGVVWHAGRTFVRSGVETRVVTRTAPRDYEFGKALEAEGVKVWSRPSSQTTTFVNEYTAKTSDERTQRALALADPIEPSDLLEALADADLVYLGPLHPADLSDNTLSLMSEKPPSCLALDVQGYTRFVQNEHVLPRLDIRLLPLLDVCDVIKANEKEACLITSTSDPASAVVNLACSHPSMEVVVTCGAKGVYVAQSEAINFVESKKTDVYDSTGAGDIFFASYITHRLNGFLALRAAELATDITAGWLVDPNRNVIL
ncbi:MAG: PfkB family carbohydrate kinase [Arenicellales bacterium]|nr:PfkB family carbohydrate kinase [Arenicellales bacterium]